MREALRTTARSMTPNASIGLIGQLVRCIPVAASAAASACAGADAGDVFATALDIASAAYEWNYARQMMQIQSAGQGVLSSADLFTADNLIERPLLEALRDDDGGAPVLLIDELDRRQPQVLIECALVELTTGDLERFGVELGLVDLAENGDFTRGFGFTNFGRLTSPTSGG